MRHRWRRPARRDRQGDLEGVAYHAWIEREPLGEPVTQRRPTDPRAIGRDLAAIVARAHAAGHVLGGLRPELVDSDGTRCFEQVYMSPEAVAMRPVTAASDVFSLCATLAYLSTASRHSPART